MVGGTDVYWRLGASSRSTKSNGGWRHVAAVVSGVTSDHRDNTGKRGDCDRRSPEEDFRAAHRIAPNSHPAKEPPPAGGRTGASLTNRASNARLSEARFVSRDLPDEPFTFANATGKTVAYLCGDASRLLGSTRRRPARLRQARAAAVASKLRAGRLCAENFTRCRATPRSCRAAIRPRFRGDQRGNSKPDRCKPHSHSRRPDRRRAACKNG